MNRELLLTLKTWKVLFEFWTQTYLAGGALGVLRSASNHPLQLKKTKSSQTDSKTKRLKPIPCVLRSQTDALENDPILSPSKKKRSKPIHPY